MLRDVAARSSTTSLIRRPASYLWREIKAFPGPVSYTHLTLPTIYSV